MSNELVSVVIPVYNVEKYLNRCIESIIHQTYQNLEIILVDDGSTDQSGLLCDEWTKKDSRIQVIHKSNAGLGMARNSGIDVAQGSYILFIDSDDYIENKTIELCLNSALKDHVDIVKFGFDIQNHLGQSIKVKIPQPDQDIYKDQKIISYVLHYMLGADTKIGKQVHLNMSACMALFSMKFIQDCNWRFVSEREYISEDYYSLYELFHYVHSVSFLKEALYHYCMNNESLSHSYDENRLNRINQWHQSMVALFQKYQDPSYILSDLASQYLGSVIGCIKLALNSDIDNKRVQVMNMLKDQYLINSLKEINLQDQPLSRQILIWNIQHQWIHIAYILFLIKR